ncbi:MAG TPA: hypothetical protein VN761_01690 [Candidatus Polarisedimenticolia bacterium]|nr:hypothetical protein [Candidatus Polarisedimenticolia bacterium]
MRGDKVFRRGDPCLPRENLFSQNAVNFRVGIKAGIFENNAAEIQIKGPPQRGENDPAGGDAKENEVFDFAGAKDHLKIVIGKRADSLFINHQVARLNKGTMKFGRRCAFDKEIILFHAQKRRFEIWNFRVSRRKSKADMNNQKLIFSGELNRFRSRRDCRINRRKICKNAFLKIEC